MKTFQDFQKEQAKGNTIEFIRQAINEHRASEQYKIALDADEYEAQRNTTIMSYVKQLYTMDGRTVPDFTSSNNRLASNFYHRLNTQRRCYSIGNGISFTKTERVTVNGIETTVDRTKDFLGNDFDSAMDKAVDFALRHGISFVFWNMDHADIFKFTEFVPLWDEETGSLKAGIRYWSLDWQKRPVFVVLYEEEGYTKFRTRQGSVGLDIVLDVERKPYKQTIASSQADGEMIVGGSNYSDLPIVPLWANKAHQSTLVGMKGKIDAYDLIASGFANDLEDCAEIYWIVGNAMGMDDGALAKFRDRLKFQHIATADLDNSSITPYTQDIPTGARTAFLETIRNQIYEDFGALDVHTVAAGTTNDHIDAAYQPMDEEADDLEYQIIQCIRQILKLNGIDDMPIFKRNRISNQAEQVNMLMMAANYLDDETILKKLPFLTVDEVQKVLLNRDAENDSRFAVDETEEQGEMNG